MDANLYSFKFVLLIFVLATALYPDTAWAQQLGIANSNYAGTNSLYTNPSAIADSRHGFYLNLFSAEAGVSNNYVRYDSPVSLYRVYKDELEFQSEDLKEELNGKPKFVTADVDFRGPSFMLRLSPKHSVAFTSRVRGSFQATNLSEDFARVYRLYKDGRGDEENYLDEYRDLANRLTQNNTFNLSANLYSELGLSYARVVLDQKEHFLKARVTVKRLAGGHSAHMINEGTDFQVEERPVAGQDKKDIVLILERTKLKFGYLTQGASDVINMLAGRNSAGQGWGADLGFTYEFRPNSDQYRSMMDGKEVIDQEKNKYKFRIAVALMDLGGINYDNPLYVKGYNTEKDNKELNLSAFAREENIEDVE